MEEKDNPTLYSQYNNLFININLMEPSLKLLYNDYLLNRLGYKITYAIDFHEMWNFAGFLDKSKADSEQGARWSKSRSFEKQIARACLFYGLEENTSLVLLPPYFEEFNSSIALARAGIIESVNSLGSEEIRKLNEIVQEKEVKQALSEFRNNEKKISPDLINRLIELLEKRVGELLYLISGISGRGLSIIHDILSAEPPILQTADIKWKELEHIFDETIDLVSSGWYHLFNKLRKGATISNQRDAKAIEQVLKLNENLKNKKELVFIVSDTLKMREVLRKNPEEILKEITEKTRSNNTVVSENRNLYSFSEADGVCIEITDIQTYVPIYRPIEMFYYSILFREKNLSDTIDNVKTEIDRIEQIYIWKKSFDELLNRCGKCLKEEELSNCQFNHSCKEMREQLRDYNEILSERANVMLAVNRFPILRPFFKQAEDMKNDLDRRLENSVLTLLKYLSEPRDILDNNIKEKQQDIQEMLDEDLKKALKDSIELVMGISSKYRKEISEGLDKFSRTRYRIRFQDQIIAQTLKNLEGARYGGNAPTVSQSVKQLIDRAFEKTLGPEKSLLWAVLLVCYRLPDRAIQLINVSLSDITPEYKSEYLYLKALAFYENGEPTQAIIECQEAIREYASDARFHNLCSFAISKIIETKRNTNFSWSDAINYAKKAHTLNINFHNDPSLQGAIVNNLAYFYCRRHSSDDLEQAEKYADELRKITPFYDQEPEYINTIGWINKTRALHNKNRERKSELAKQALSDFSKALELAKKLDVSQNEINALANDLEEAKNQFINITL